MKLVIKAVDGNDTVEDSDRLEELVDADINLFDNEMQSTSGAAPLTRYERAIIKTYLVSRLMKTIG